MDVTDYFVMLVGCAVIATVVYGGYRHALQTRQQDGSSTAAKYMASKVPAE